MLAMRDQGSPLAELHPERRETYGTTIIDAVPDQVIVLPGPTLWPLVLTVAVAVLLASILTGFYAATGVGVLIGVVAMAGWHWPGKERRTA